MRAHLTLLLLPVGLGVLSVAPQVVADDSNNANNKATAQALFDKARPLAEAGNWAQACPLYAESQRLDPGIGTLYQLANCYEHIGRTASAWALFVEVADKSALKGQTERAEEGRRRAGLLEPKLVRLTVTVGAQTDGLVVKRDGEVLGQGQLGTALPIDPGKHVLDAEAPGKKPWHQDVDVSQTTEVAVPALEDGPAVAVPPPGPPETAPSNGYKVQRGIGIAVGAIGVVGVGLGSFFGFQSMSKKSNADSECVGKACSAQGLQDRNDAVTAGNISTVAFIAGGVLVAGGVVLWLTAKAPSHQVGVRLVPVVGAGSGGLFLDGKF